MSANTTPNLGTILLRPRFGRFSVRITRFGYSLSKNYFFIRMHEKRIIISYFRGQEIPLYCRSAMKYSNMSHSVHIITLSVTTTSPERWKEVVMHLLFFFFENMEIKICQHLLFLHYLKSHLLTQNSQQTK